MYALKTYQYKYLDVETQIVYLSQETTRGWELFKANYSLPVVLLEVIPHTYRVHSEEVGPCTT